MRNQHLQQKLRSLGHKLGAIEEYEQYLRSEYGAKYVPKRSVEQRLLRTSHRSMLQDLYRRERRA